MAQAEAYWDLVEARTAALVSIADYFKLRPESPSMPA
jgi:hypothetical protein